MPKKKILLKKVTKFSKKALYLIEKSKNTEKSIKLDEKAKKASKKAEKYIKKLPKGRVVFDKKGNANLLSKKEYKKYLADMENIDTETVEILSKSPKYD